MNALLLVYTCFLTIVIVGGIHYYEAKLKSKSLEMDGSHYTAVQLANIELREQIRSLDADNKILQAQIERYRLNISELRAGLHTGFPSPNIE